MEREPDYRKIGLRVRQARKKSGMTQQELAKAISCSNYYISHIESGKTKVSLNILLHLAYELSMPLDYFLSDTPYSSRSYILNEEIAELLECCDKEELIAVKEIIEVFVRYRHPTK